MGPDPEFREAGSPPVLLICRFDNALNARYGAPLRNEGALMSSMSRATGLLLAALASFLLPLAASAQGPQLINYQGRLVNGTNLVNGSVGLSLRLFDASSGGTKLYEDSNTVTVADGLYSTLIGDGTNFGNLPTALETTNVWIEVAVNGAALSPRERLVSVAYALGARSAQGVAANAITASMLATGAVQAIHLAPGAVTAAALADGAVSSAKSTAKSTAICWSKGPVWASSRPVSVSGIR